ncbi:zinc-ribbon domain-containing protein [uncultured Microbacterium sp.]|uniref:zinc-ribbon domain-containing protein n=1 Tax=uncultured Microbacterium sp. TaxID=191216 RepID=UPI0028E53FA3|nr:zinc-ribbon domain-containing protein [uncultured Microbacterium sp.]
MTPTTLYRRFPFTVRPGHRETLDSFTRRTLIVNGESTSLPRHLVTLAKAHDAHATWESLLSTKVRRPLDSLIEVPPLDDPGLDECESCRSQISERWACLLCSHGEHIQQHPHLDDFICERHGRWTGPGTTAETQTAVTAADVAAHRRFQRLRRGGGLDLHLFFEVLSALEGDLDQLTANVFRHAVAIVDWVQRDETVHHLFDPAVPYSTTFAWLREAMANIVAHSTPAAARAVWLHLWPAQLALNTALRGYAGYRAGNAHDFQLPDDITSWYPRPSALQSTREYLACTGDDNLSALARLVRDSGDAPTVAEPQFRTIHCTRGHLYIEVRTADEDDVETPCPTCTGVHVERGVNDLETVSPLIGAQLHPTLNGDLTAAGITARSHTVVWWRCPDKGHPFRAMPSNRTLNDAGCAVCLNRVTLVGVNDLATTHPRIARELHPRNGYAKAATQLNAADPKTRDWLCPKDHPYRASVKQRVRGKSCPECKKQRTRISGRSIVDTHPYLVPSWLPELNQGHEPADYTKGSKLEVVWVCTKSWHTHTFPMRLEARTRGSDCPYCAGRLILAGFNDFATTDPELVSDWHPYRNRRYPNEVMRGSNDKHHWRCKDGHETEQSIPNRRLSGGCVECPRHERPGNTEPRSTKAKA